MRSEDPTQVPPNLCTSHPDPRPTGLRLAAASARALAAGAILSAATALTPRSTGTAEAAAAARDRDAVTALPEENCCCRARRPGAPRGPTAAAVESACIAEEDIFSVLFSQYFLDRDKHLTGVYDGGDRASTRRWSEDEEGSVRRAARSVSVARVFRDKSN